MFTKLMKDLTNQDRAAVLSITNTVATVERASVIQRNAAPAGEVVVANDICLRAREIYLRARRHRPVRASSIF